MNLRTKLFVGFVIASAVPAGGVALVAYLDARADLRSATTEHLESVATIQTERLEAVFDGYRERARVVVATPLVRLLTASIGSDYAASQERRAQLARVLEETIRAYPSFRSVTVLGMDGEVLAGAGEEPAFGAAAVGDVLQTGRDTIAINVFAPVAGAGASVWMTAPVLGQETPIGQVVITAGLEEILEVVEDFTGIGETGEILLARRGSEGEAVFIAPTRFDPDAAFQRRVFPEEVDVPMTRALAGQQGRLESGVDYRGQPVLASVRHLPNPDWGVVVKIDRAEAFAPVASLARTTALIAVALTLALGVFSFFASRAIARPLGELAATADRIGSGDYRERASVDTDDEIGSLALSFNGMADRLIEANRELEDRVATRTQELASSEEMFRALVEDVEDYAIFMIDPQGRVATWNHGAEMGTGYTAEEALGTHLSLFFEEVHGRERIDRHLAAARDSGRTAIEGWHERKGGARRWMSAAITALHREDGELRGYSIVARDLTARLQAESRRKRFFDLSSELLAVANSDGNFVDLNAAWTRTLGWSQEELMARPFLDFVHPDDRERTLEEAASLGEGGATTNFENRYATSNGGWVWLGWTSVLDPETGEIMAAAHDVTAERALRDELERARREAEAVARAKSQFLANMSHEIRTPMNAVIGMSTLLGDTELDEEQADFLRTIRSSGDHLLTIINDILDYSKIEAGMLRLERHPFAVRTVVEEALDLTASAAAAKDLELAYIMEEGAPAGLRSDPGRLRQVLVNLLSNAVKFTQKGEVVVTVRGADVEDGSVRVVFEVRDTGQGISDEQLARIFEAFEQADPSSTRRFGGTGLGLTISRHLCALMGGKLSAESQIGAGSVFRAEIVAEAVPEGDLEPWYDDSIELTGARALVVDDSEINRRILEHWLHAWGMEAVSCASGPEALKRVAEGERWDIVLLDHQMPDMNGATLTREIRRSMDIPIVMLTSLDRDATIDALELAGIVVKPLRPSRIFDVIAGVLYNGSRTDAAPTKTFDSAMATRLPLRILIAEDNSVNQRVATGMLSTLGYAAAVASNGREAVEAVRRQTFDVVLMDLQMPEMDGLEATREIRRTDAVVPQPRIVAMTAHAGEDIRRQCMDAGMDDYLTKPISPEKLVQALSRGGRGGHQSSAEDEASEAAKAMPFKTPEVEPVDAEAFRRLQQALGGDAEVMAALVRNYRESTPQLMDEMVEAAEKNDRDVVRSRAHNLKSSSAQLGGLPLSAMLADLERRATEAADRDGLMPAAKTAREELGRVLEALDNLLEEEGVAETE